MLERSEAYQGGAGTVPAEAGIRKIARDSPRIKYGFSLREKRDWALIIINRTKYYI
jgi:hypothetical protein